MAARPARHALLASLVVWTLLLLGWKLAKYAVLGGIEVGLWRSEQEFAMALPRLAALLAVLALGLHWWTAGALGWTWRGGRATFGSGGLFLVAFLIGQRSAGPLALVVSWPVDLAIAAVMVGVALFEEVAFRGVLYRLLADLTQPRAAVWGTALAYSIAHLDTSPTAYEFARNALTGLLFGQLRASTGSFVGLVAVHAAQDFLWWIVRPTTFAEPVEALRLLHILVLAALVVTHACRHGSPWATVGAGGSGSDH